MSAIVMLLNKRFLISPHFPGLFHDDVIKWKHFPRCWHFVRGIHRSPVDSPLKRKWRGVLVFYLIRAWTNGWANNRDAGDLRRYRAHYDVTLMFTGAVTRLLQCRWIMIIRGNIGQDIIMTSHERRGIKSPATWLFAQHQRKHQMSTSMGLCEGNPPVTGGFPSKRASDAESVSMLLRHHEPQQNTRNASRVHISWGVLNIPWFSIDYITEE